MTNTETAVADTALDAESTKRRQIMSGAEAVFLAQGFDGASMGEIARRAGVSKGTLYVYFASKEQLFVEIFEEACMAQAEQTLSIDSGDHDVEAALTRFGCDYVRFLCAPSRLSPLRTIISIADRMPEIGRRFYQFGPARGIAVVKGYLDDQIAVGILQIADAEVAAAQFLETCQALTFRPMLFNFADAPSEERIRYVVGIAVRTFLAAYRRPMSSGGASC
ncbi:MAG TPA: TetR/AcrR family transcriptional regulator [Xanthobacteraceae bacterium]|nr:TetR/AcrR family transcriptional regulator [Xanthobacteraceae bacterium]